MKNIWVIADMAQSAYELLSIAQGNGEQITAYVNGDEEAGKLCFEYGATTVKLIPVPENTTWEQYGKQIAEDGKEVQPELILVSATRRGKTIAATIAALLDCPCITESKTVDLEGGKVSATRTIFGGLAEKDLEVDNGTVVISVAPGTVEAKKAEAAASGEMVKMDLPENGLVVQERKEKEASSINLNEADVVIGVGRGFGKEENLKYAEELASILDGEIGCSRPVTEDFKWYPEERYIGISGAVIKPNLYIAAGISGQIQHVYGIRDAKTIVAIDKNENAPIFNVADYYIVGDLEEVLPELIEALK